MSKKRRRKNKRSAPYLTQKDFHHFFYSRVNWSKKYSAHALRSHPYCGAYLFKYSTHNAVHNAVEGVPVPSEEVCRLTLQQLNTMLEYGQASEKDSPVKKISILISIIEPLDSDVAEALKRQREVIRKG